MNITLQSPLAVVCHDAGATNLILPWLKGWQGELRPFMTGPARLLWMRYFPQLSLLDHCAQALEGANALLSGTGWASSNEHDARIEAARRKIHSVAVLDHWVNYENRFVRGDIFQLPDVLWVADAEAEIIARQKFPALPIFRQPNLYLQEQLARIGSPPRRQQVLYLLEPMLSDWGRGIEGEFQALDYAIENLSVLGVGTAPQLILRPHPSESEEKYQSYLDNYEFIRFDRSNDLSMAISEADVVIGLESQALTVALQAGRPAFSAFPPWGPKMRLPYAGIVEIRHLPLA